jgi:hypothetical protein
MDRLLEMNEPLVNRVIEVWDVDRLEVRDLPLPP